MGFDTFLELPIKINIYVLYYKDILWAHIFPREMRAMNSKRYAVYWMFVGEKLKKFKDWAQLKCPTTKEWNKHLWNINIMGY